MIRIFRVSGASMEPDYREGDFVLVLRARMRQFKPGTPIAFMHPDYGLLIKKVDYSNLESKVVWVSGTKCTKYSISKPWSNFRQPNPWDSSRSIPQLVPHFNLCIFAVNIIASIVVAHGHIQ